MPQRDQQAGFVEVPGYPGLVLPTPRDAVAKSEGPTSPWAPHNAWMAVLDAFLRSTPGTYESRGWLHILRSLRAA